MEMRQPEDCEGRCQLESKEYSWPVKKMDFLKSDFYSFFFFFSSQLRSMLVFLILKVWGLAREKVENGSSWGSLSSEPRWAMSHRKFVNRFYRQESRLTNQQSYPSYKWTLGLSVWAGKRNLSLCSSNVSSKPFEVSSPPLLLCVTSDS